MTLPERHYDLAGRLLAGAIDEAAADGSDVVARCTGRPPSTAPAVGRHGARRRRAAAWAEPPARRAVRAALAEHGYEPRHRRRRGDAGQLPVPRTRAGAHRPRLRHEPRPRPGAGRAGCRPRRLPCDWIPRPTGAASPSPRRDAGDHLPRVDGATDDGSAASERHARPTSGCRTAAARPGPRRLWLPGRPRLSVPRRVGRLGGGRRVAAGPAESATLVWTGHEVLVLGGDTSPCPPNADCVAPADTPRAVAAYDPAADTWREVAPLPYSPQWPRAVAAGDAVYVLDGGGAQPVRFLSWTPDGDTWQELPAPPGRPDGLTAVGNQLVAYQSSLENGPGPDSAFDPATREWTELPQPPGTPGFDRSVVALGDHSLVLLDLELVPNPGADGPTLYRAAVLDLGTSTWRRLPTSDVAGSGLVGTPSASCSSTPRRRPSTAERSATTAGTSRPAASSTRATGRRSALPARADRAPGPAAGDVAGDDVVVTEGWALHVGHGRWERLPDLDGLDGVGGQASVWAGDRLMVWGGARFDDETPSGELLGTGWTWQPAGAVGTTTRNQASQTGRLRRSG